MRVLLDDDCDVIKELCLCYGGMASRTVVATNTAANLVGRYDIKNKNTLYARRVLLANKNHPSLYQYRIHYQIHTLNEHTTVMIVHRIKL